MAAITENRNFFKWPKLLYFKPDLNCISIIMEIGQVVSNKKIFK
jgi:hypothetical protein